MTTWFMLFGGAMALRQHAGELALVANNLVEGNHGALQKVVNKLKEIRKEVNTEKEAESALYKKNSCWCNNNEKEKGEALQRAQEEVAQLQATIESAKGTIEAKTEEIANNQVSLDMETENLESARLQRKKENREFISETMQLRSDLADLKNAIGILDQYFNADAAEANDEMNAQRAELPSSLLSQKAFQSVVKLSRSHFDSIASDQITRFLQADKSAPVSTERYAPQSAELVGMIKQMHENMQKNFDDVSAGENENASMYAELKATKEQVISELEETIALDQDIVAESKDAHTTGELDLKSTQKQIEKDMAFVQNLEKTCGDLDAVYQENQAARGEELKAISDVVTMLTSDETRDLFSNKTPQAGAFLQTIVSKKAHSRTQAAQLLKAAFRKSGDIALLSLSAQVNLNAFENVKADIDKLIQAIQQQKVDDVRARDTCIATFHEIEINSKEAQSELDRLSALIASKTGVKNGLEEEITTAAEDLQATKVALQEEAENYVQVSKDFQHFVSESKAMIHVMVAAKKRLEQFYSTKKENTQFVQLAAGQSPPEAMSKYEQNKSSGGIMGFMEEIVSDFKIGISAGEAEAQQSVDNYVKSADEGFGVIRALEEKIDSKNQEKAILDGEILENKGLQKQKLSEADDLSKAGAAEHQTCDFLLQNFEERQDSMSTEVQALKEVVSILAGMQ